MNKATVNIRQELPGDVASVRNMLVLAFGEEDEAELVDRLRAAVAFTPELSLVAEVAGEIVGHVLFNPVTIKTEDAEIAIVSLAPLAVHPDYQRQGIGQLLSKHGFDVARSLGYRIAIVVGHPSYYPRLGFAQAGPLGIQDWIAYRPEGSMVIALVEGALNGVRGEVIYPPEFEKATPSVSLLLDVAQQTIAAAGLASLITVDEAGWPSSRAVAAFSPDEHFSRIVIGTHPDSRKTAHVLNDPRVVLSYVDQENRGYLTVIGKAQIQAGSEERTAFWVDRFNAFFPDGPESDEYQLMIVVPERLELRSFGLKVAEEPTHWSPVILNRAPTGQWQYTH